MRAAAPPATHHAESMRDTPLILPLRLTDVTYERAGMRLIDRISATIEAEGISVILGPNGAGKSLLLRLCHGLIQPTNGTIVWQNPQHAAARQAMVFQRPVLLRRTAAANIDHALKLRHFPRVERRKRAASALAQAGLTDLANRRSEVLSGGEQQRLAVARAWAIEPSVLFLDEPTAHLDPAATAAIEDMILGFKTAGVKIILTTHDLHQARRLADDVLMLHHGRLLEHGPAATFFQRPKTQEARAFVDGKLIW